jgi:Bacterial PH domain
MRSSSPHEADPVPDPITSAVWRVDRSMLVFKIIGMLAFALIPSLIGLNLETRWFGFVVAAVLAAYAVRDVAAPVRLSADAEGVTVVHGYAGHRRLAWSEIERVRLDTMRRAPFMEIDAGESLHLFSRYDLGMPPDEALAMIEQIMPPPDQP